MEGWWGGGVNGGDLDVLHRKSVIQLYLSLNVFFVCFSKKRTEQKCEGCAGCLGDNLGQGRPSTF